MWLRLLDSFVQNHVKGPGVIKMLEGGNGFQSIVISLKDSFYDKAKAVVGVYRDAERR